jgi:hypothetical protein
MVSVSQKDAKKKKWNLVVLYLLIKPLYLLSIV